MEQEIETIELPSGRSLDLRRDRSAGPLDREEFETCLARRVRLAYDPTQIGWVVADCPDDIDLPDGSAANAPSTAEIQAALQTDFERRSHAILRSRTTGGMSREDAMDAIWRSAEDAIRVLARTHPIPPRLQRAALDLLHEQAAALLQSQLVVARQRTARRAHCAKLAGRYLLRPWRADDAPRLTTLLGNPNIWKYLPNETPEHLDEEAARGLIELSHDDTRHEVRAIERDGHVVGQVRLDFRGADSREAEISYWIGEPHWGQGFATDAVMLFTHLSFRNHDIDSIFARIHRDHAASARIARKAGYRFEGTLRSKLDPEPWIHIHRVFRGDYAGSTPARVVPLFGAEQTHRRPGA